MIHLQVRSEFSLLDGTISIDRLIELAKKNNMPALALTDNGVMYGAMDFYLKAKKAGIKPIIGCDMRIIRNKDEELKDALRMIILCKDYLGYQNLSKIVSMACTATLKEKPVALIDYVLNNQEGLIFITHGKIGEYSEYLERFKDIYIGVTRTGTIFEEDIEKDNAVFYGSAFNIPIVAINNIYFEKREHARLRDIVYCIQKDKRVDWDMGVETEETYFKSKEEMQAIFTDIPEAIENTIKIAEKCNVDIPTDQVLMPDFDIPEGFTPSSYLKELTYNGLKVKYSKITKEIEDRANYELEVIDKMGFPTYFLIVWDVIRYARESDIPVGDSRGSVGGSIVAYALDITRLDPIRHNLIFERFLNPERVSMPDIDLDFCINKRHLVFEYFSKKYGSDRVAHIGTFGTLAPRAVIRDVGRALSIPLGEVDKIAKMINHDSIQGALDNLEELRAMYSKHPSIRKLLLICDKLEGNARHVSMHAAGVIISKEPLSHTVPLLKSDEDIVTQYPMSILEKMGLLKMDILGLRNLTVISDCLSKIKNNYNLSLDLDCIGLDDKKTYDLLQKGLTSGVFQLESDGMKNLITKLKPDRFEDIVALLALYRPGPLGSKMDRTFVANKKNPSRIKHDIEELRPILNDTYGVILYQEQVMKISNVVAGFSMAQADMLRKAIGKKNAEQMANLKDSFVNGAVLNGHDKKKVEDLYTMIEKFAAYSFNLSHSAGYARISYKTAYLKANYPVEYMTSLLSSTINNLDKTAFYIQECRELGVEMLCPDINKSIGDFSIEDGKIRFGLHAVKGIGAGPCEAIIKGREKEPYKSLFDFLIKIDTSQINKKTVECLIKCGAFDSLSDRSYLLAIYELVLSRAHNLQKDCERDGISIDGDPEKQLDLDAMEIVKNGYKEYSHVEKLNMEKEIVGLYMSGHPLSAYTSLLNEMRYDISKIDNTCDGITVDLIGVLSDCKHKKTKIGKEYVMSELTDLVGSIKLLFFPNYYNKKFIDNFISGSVVAVKGRLKCEDKEKVMFVNEIKII